MFGKRQELKKCAGWLLAGAVVGAILGDHFNVIAKVKQAATKKAGA